MKERGERMSVGSEPEGMYGDIQGSEGERIFVSVRLRPLNDRELARHDVSDWECINNSTIIFKSNMPDRSMFPTAYTFDRVFGSECHTKQVYEEGAKEIALSALSGINSSIFAYGQTSSGKTYTLSAITEYALSDIYEYMDKHKEREFVLKFSAMEIYNEAVRDLLSSDSTPLRLLDDPERGTIVEKLIEETLSDWSHLQELLSICEAQRQIGETLLNETSSRSHQILRLTVESSAREHSGAANSSTLEASLNFVDLAGSERASQTLAVGTRLKEGSHINRSLLTLGTVIRKLSKGRTRHIPYRDSKLTRILQNSLGGHARTAIICTMSPARSHVEQSRNTLLFASCAKEVTTNAQVNVVMSDKALVKQLQKELARLESRLRSGGSIAIAGDSAALPRERDFLIEQMDKQIKELTWQRDLAQSRVESFLKSVGEDRLLRVDDYSTSESSEVVNPLHPDVGFPRRNNDSESLVPPNKQILQIPESTEDNFLLDNSTPKFFGLNPGDCWEEITKRYNEEYEGILNEVPCVEMEESMKRKAKADALLTASKEEEENLGMTGAMNDGAIKSKEEDEADVFFASKENEENLAMRGAMNDGAVNSTKNENEELGHINSTNTHDALKQKIQELHKTINQLNQSPSCEAGASSSRSLLWTRSRSRRSVLMTIPSSLWSETEEDDENLPTTLSGKDLPGRAGGFEQKLPELEHDAEFENLPEKVSQNSLDAASAEEVIKEIDIDLDDTTSVLDFVGANKMAKPQSEFQIGDALAPEASTRINELRISTRNTGTDRVNDGRLHQTNWLQKFERYRRKIIDLWVRCNVPLVHRSYFFLLFKGDPSDNVYMEVELRRLYFLRDTSVRGTNTMLDTRITSLASSLKAVNREREILARQLQKKFTKGEREGLYLMWGIELETKQRSLQLARSLWTDTRDMRHIKESALLVTKLIGFVEPRYLPKEMFGLSLLTPSTNQRSSSWRDNMSSLSLL